MGHIMMHDTAVIKALRSLIDYTAREDPQKTSSALMDALQDVSHRLERKTPTQPESDAVVVDAMRRTVKINGKVIRPSCAQFEICRYLSSWPGAVRSRVQIMDAAGIGLEVSDTAIRDHVKRLRALGVSAIRTAQGVGYYWAE